MQRSLIQELRPVGLSLQCIDTVGWATEGYPACKKLDVGLLMVTI